MINYSKFDKFEDPDEELGVASLYCDETKYRSSAWYRKRWDSEYLVNLAISEGSFTTEYRLRSLIFYIVWLVID